MKILLAGELDHEEERDGPRQSRQEGASVVKRPLFGVALTGTKDTARKARSLGVHVLRLDPHRDGGSGTKKMPPSASCSGAPTGAAAAAGAGPGAPGASGHSTHSPEDASKVEKGAAAGPSAKSLLAPGGDGTQSPRQHAGRAENEPRPDSGVGQSVSQSRALGAGGPEDRRLSSAIRSPLLGGHLSSMAS